MSNRSTETDGWVVTTLDQLATLAGGGTPSRSQSEYFGTDIDWVTPSDLPPLGHVDVLGPVAEGLTKSGLANSSAKAIPPGSVLLSSRASIGKVAVTDRVCATNQGFASFIPNTNVADPWFLAYLLCHHTPAITRLAGETTYKEVSRSKLKAFNVRVPSLNEQRRIVTKIQKAVDRLREIRKLREQIYQEAAAVFPSLLADWFGDTQKAYPIRTVEEVSLETKYGTSRRCSRKHSGSPVLRIPNVSNGEVSFVDLKWCDQLSEGELSKLRLEDGDLLVVRTNGSQDFVGRCAVFQCQDRPYVYASYLIRIRPDHGLVDPHFLAFFLESTMGRDTIVERMRTSAGQYNINSKNLWSIPFPCPPLDVQRGVVEQMIDQRRVINAIEAQHNDIEEQDRALHQAVLHKAFAGEL